MMKAVFLFTLASCVVAMVRLAAINHDKVETEKLLKRERRALSYGAAGLAAHNHFRAIHDANNLQLDKGLTKDAQSYANEMANSGRFQHASGISDGENLAFACYGQNTILSAAAATNMWYNEVCDPGYDFTNNHWSYYTGHFTQVVWKATTKLGIAMATGRKYGFYCTYVVARYRTAGNYGRSYAQNVKKGSFDKNTVC